MQLPEIQNRIELIKNQLQLLAGGAGVPAALLAPKALIAAPFMSPRLVGEALHRGAQVTGDPRTQAVIDALRRVTPAITRSAQDD